MFSRGSLSLALFCVFCFSVGVVADPPQRGDLSAVGGKLDLSVGTIETSQLPNLAGPETAAFTVGKAHVLQLRAPITPAVRKDLEDAGVYLGDYLPENAYIVDVDGVAPATLAAMDSVAWVGEFQNDWKLDSQLGRRRYSTPERQALADSGRTPVIVTVFEGRDAGAVVAAISAIDGAMLHFTDMISRNVTISATLPSDSVTGLALLDAVQYVEEAPELTYRNASDRWIVQSNVLNVTPLYDNGIHGEGQIVGVIDGQADQQHCSLDGGKILFYNAPDGNDTHGTHTSCTAVGDDTSNANLRGVAYLGNMVFDTIPSFTEAAILAVLNQHHGQGARMHTNSWGDDGTTNYNSLCRGFDSFQYSNEDDVVCLAVTNLSSLKNPENAKNLLAVGASQDTPNQANHCSGGTGPTADGRRKPEIYAPGCSTTSATPSACSTTNLTGTSMASPAVAGTAALVRQYYADGYYPTGVETLANAFVPSGALVKATLLNSAVDMTGIAGYPSNQEGWGRVLADNALFFPGNARMLVVLADVRNADGLSTGQNAEYNLTVTDSIEQLRVTLVWTDPPASAGTGGGAAWINDIDLEVVAPGGGSLFKGNWFSAGVSVPGGSKDNKNNVEQVHVNTPATGLWTVRVVGAAVNQGLQGYALIATGQAVGTVPALTINLPSGTPATMPPATPVNFDVEILPGDENIVAGSETLHYRYDGGVFLTAVLTPVGGGMYTATLPAANCGDTPEFYVSAQGDGATTVTEPSDAPTTVFSAVVGEDVVTTDDFETDQGWVSGAPGDTATLGMWNRMDPQGTAAQPEDDHTTAPGAICWVTDGNAGGSVGAFDVDGGKTTLLSPMIDLSTSSSATISYWRWFSNNQGGAPNTDIFTVDISNDGGTNWVNVETVGPAGPEAGGGWFYHEFDVSGIVAFTSQVRVRFVADDAGAGSVVEAAVDDLTVAAFACNQVVCATRGNMNGDAGVDGEDLAGFVNCFLNGSPAQQACICADMDASGTFEQADVTSFVNCLLGIACP